MTCGRACLFGLHGRYWSAQGVTMAAFAQGSKRLWRHARSRASTAVGVWLCMAPTPFIVRPVGASSAPASEINAEAHARFDDGERARDGGDLSTAGVQFLAAARLWAGAFAESPTDTAAQRQGSIYIFKALKAYRLAFDVDPKQCDILKEAIGSVNKYLANLEQRTPKDTALQDEVKALNVQRGLFLSVREDQCPEVAAGPVVQFFDMAATPPIETAKEGPKNSEPVAPPRPIPGNPTETGQRPLLIATIASASIGGVLLATSLGSGLSRASGPVAGAAYKNIYKAAVASVQDGDPGNDVAFGRGDDLCGSDARARNIDVNLACRQWYNLKTVAIVTGVVAGVAAIVASTTGALLARRRARERAGHEHRQWAVRVEPGAVGWGLRF